MAEVKALRRDARNSIEKLQTAAREAFRSEGLGVPLQTIAEAARVSVGTLYHRFGSREALIDAVMCDIVDERLQAVRAAVDSTIGSRQRLETFVHEMIDLQVADLGLNDAILRRFPAATALAAVCDMANQLGTELLDDAHQDESLDASFTADDLRALLWLAGTAARAQDAPTEWRPVLERSLAGAWREAVKA